LKSLYKKDYPYMYARVSAKKSKLYTEKDYNRFLKMEVNEISRKMEEGEYSKEINQLGSEFDGADLIEKALNQNLEKTLNHLLKISSEDAKPIIEAYTRRFDLMAYKKILRWKQQEDNRELTEEIKISAEKVGLDSEDLEKEWSELLEEVSFENSMVDYQEMLENCEQSDLEICLDKIYSKEMRKVASNTRSKEFQDYVENEQFYHDLVLALRLKKYDVEQGKIKDKMVSEKLDEIIEVIETPDFDTALKAAERITGAAGDTLEEMEHSIEQRRLQDALSTLYKEPLGLSSTIGYMVAKTIEVENIRMIARAKETGIQNTETIKGNLVLN